MTLELLPREGTTKTVAGEVLRVPLREIVTSVQLYIEKFSHAELDVLRAEANREHLKRAKLNAKQEKH